MKIFDPFDASLLVAAAGAPVDSDERKRLVHRLSDEAREFGIAILDENAKVSRDARHTARSLQRWAKREREAKVARGTE